MSMRLHFGCLLLLLAGCAVPRPVLPPMPVPTMPAHLERRAEAAAVEPFVPPFVDLHLRLPEVTDWDAYDWYIESSHGMKTWTARPALGTVILEWDHDGERVEGYRVWYEQETCPPDTVTTERTSAVLEGLEIGECYRFWVTAYDRFDRDSEPSEVITYTIPNKPARLWRVEATEAQRFYRLRGKERLK